MKRGDTFPKGCLCHYCGELVRYTAGRRRCQRCHRWCHEKCSVKERLSSYKAVCYSCVQERPEREQLVVMLHDIDGQELAVNGELLKSGLVYLASIFIGTDEARISEVTKLRPDEVAERGARLKESGLWDGSDAYVDCTGIENPTPFEYNLCVLIGVMCANGDVVRKRVSSQGPSGPDGPASSAHTPQPCPSRPR